RQDLDSLRASAARRGFRAVPLGVGVEGEVRQTIDRKASPNVIGMLQGVNSRQGVVYTAHYDHLGIRETKDGRDRIYNGARDNASGVAGILSVAQAFTRTTAQPGRSVYFLATTAEESGLLGATHFAQHPPIPIDQIAANINVDELNVWGRTTDIVLLGSERSRLGPVAAELARARNRRLGTDPSPERGSFFRSDHFPLAKAGVPALSISDPVEYIGKDAAFAKKVHDEYNDKLYHQPGDEYNVNWDFTGAVEDMRLLAELGWQIAAAPAMPAYNKGDQFARPREKRTKD
ncbi:MAG: M20/M25/M40 family metallo-hydrolase, partial [Acidimicrobiia bacterium]